MFYKNARIFAGDFRFHTGAFEVQDGVFGKVLPATIPSDAVDLHGATVIPGLVDIHTHGCCGADFSDGDYQGLKKMAAYYAQRGVTSFVPASMTLPYNVLEAAFSNAGRLHKESGEGLSVLRGIYMEGPYLSIEKRGAQNADYLKLPDFDDFKKLYDACGGLIRVVCIAPELPGAEKFIAKAKDLCTVSVAHSNGDYAQAKAAFSAGASHITHLFNAMPGIGHRAPGIIPAAAEDGTACAEIICDGHHVHPAAVRLAFSLFGGNRMILVSDSGRCAGMPDGSTFSLGGQLAQLQNGVGRLKDGTIACSAADLWQCLSNAISWNIPEEDAVRAATYNPARAVAADKIVGTIESGKRADFIITNADYSEKQVFLGGKKLECRQALIDTPFH